MGHRMPGWVGSHGFVQFSGERRELVPTGGDRAESPEGGSGRFVRSPNGHVTAALLGDDRPERLP